MNKLDNTTLFNTVFIKWEQVDNSLLRIISGMNQPKKIEEIHAKQYLRSTVKIPHSKNNGGKTSNYTSKILRWFFYEQLGAL